MTQPAPYTPTIDFSNEEATGVSGRSTVRTTPIDAEFANIATTLSQILTNLALLQRDDTELMDRIVELHTLSDAVRAVMATAGTNPRGDWVTATAYAAKDVVSQGTGTYICVTAHTSGVFATDLAADKWIVIFDSAAYIASGIAFTPVGTIASTNVQLALAEVASEAAQKSANLGDLTNAVTARANLGFPAIAAKGDLIAGSAANTLATKTVGTDGYGLQAQSGTTDGLQYLPTAPFNIENGYIDWTVAGNVLTAAIKTWAGTDPSVTDPVYIVFRSDTAATGSLVKRKLTAATSISINDTATLGTINSTSFRLWCVAFDDGGTVRLAVINTVVTASTIPHTCSLSAWGIASSTLEDNASDSAHVFYSSGAAVAAKPYAVLGYATWEGGLAAAGTWSAGPTRKQLYGIGTPLPGTRLQSAYSSTGAYSSTTTTIPGDDTIPQNTEGAQVLSRSIDRSSGANVLEISAVVVMDHDTSDTAVTVALFQDATANALAAVTGRNGVTGFGKTFPLRHRMLASAAGSTTFNVRGGSSAAGTLGFNGSSSGRSMGGVMATNIEIAEVMT